MALAAEQKKLGAILEAQGEAEAKRPERDADNYEALKIQASIDIHKAWADAYAKRRVPLISGSGRIAENSGKPGRISRSKRHGRSLDSQGPRSGSQSGATLRSTTSSATACTTGDANNTAAGHTADSATSAHCARTQVILCLGPKCAGSMRKQHHGRGIDHNF